MMSHSNESTEAKLCLVKQSWYKRNGALNSIAKTVKLGARKNIRLLRTEVVGCNIHSRNVRQQTHQTKSSAGLFYIMAVNLKLASVKIRKGGVRN